MTCVRPFTIEDLLKFNNVNLDQYTETYGFGFYMQYLVNWPEYFQVVEHPAGPMMGYIMGKSEGRGEQWHGHVTALSIAPEFRRIGLAAKLMRTLEEISEQKVCHFVDLYVRVAVDLYRKLGYVIYQEIQDYYAGIKDENAFDMRKALSIDHQKRSMIPPALLGGESHRTHISSGNCC